MTNRRDFFGIYLNALEKALENDHINYGYLVWSPDFYMDSDTMHQVEKFIEDELPDNDFINFVEEYFDAKSHNFPDMHGMSVEDARTYIVNEIKKIRIEYAL